MRPTLEPFSWPKAAGVWQSSMLQDYATWLHGQISRRWPDYQERPIEPYRPTHSAGVCFTRDLKHFSSWAFPVLQPVHRQVQLWYGGTVHEYRVPLPVKQFKERSPYVWVRHTGLAFVRHMRSLDWHLRSMIFIRDTVEELMVPFGKLGCMDPAATNFDPAATKSDGSCVYTPPPHGGCMDPEALNYDPTASWDDGTCEYTPPISYGCTDPLALNYDPAATVDNGTCIYGPGDGGEE